MKMRVLLGALFLCYCNKVGNGWQMRMETIRQPRTRAPVPTNKINVVREPAGVECLFRRAGTMRKKQMTRIRGAWRRPIHSMRRNKRVDMESSSSLERIDLWGVEKTRQDLSLPSWACDNPEEERRLAAMKIILEKDLKVLESKTITIRNNKNGSSRNVKLVQAFPDVYSDFRMLRFLRKDKEQDPVSAAVRYREFLKWRATNNVDENVRVLIDSNPFQPPPELSAVASYLPCEFRAEPSMDGIVPVLLKVGDWDTTSITQLIRSKDSSKGSSNSLTIDSFLQYWAFMFDSLHWHLYQGTYVRMWHTVYDDTYIACCNSSYSSCFLVPLTFV